MADFGYWGEAVGRGLGWPDQSFRSAYARNRRSATDSTIEDSAVADALFTSVPSSLKWSGTTARSAPAAHGERRERRCQLESLAQDRREVLDAKFAGWHRSFASAGSRSPSAEAATIA